MPEVIVGGCPLALTGRIGACHRHRLSDVDGVAALGGVLGTIFQDCKQFRVSARLLVELILDGAGVVVVLLCVERVAASGSVHGLCPT